MNRARTQAAEREVKVPSVKVLLVIERRKETIRRCIHDDAVLPTVREEI